MNGLTLCLDAANTKSILSAVEVLVVAGGGGGSGNYYDDGAGGGAGGLIYSSSHSITPGSAITATVGDGGAASSGSQGGDGGNSVFGALTAIGGGGGASHRSAGRAGGSGGGSAGQYDVSDNAVGGNGTAGQGFAGGTATGYSGSGGGGASSIGLPAGNPGWGFGGNGGNGKIYSISGTPTYYAGGGGGYGYSESSTTMGGLGGGGNGGNPTPLAPTPGTPNTGGGGGGGRTGGQVPFVGTAAGGSGIVIVRYPGSQRATGGTITSVAGHTIHTFTTSGTFTPNFGDLSNNGNTGTLTNGPTYSSANGGSLVFDGVDDKVSTNYKPSGARSYFIWVKFSSLTHPSGYQITGTQEVNAYTYIGIENGGGVYYYAGASTGGNIGNPVTVNTWVNLGFALFPDGSRRVYKNGIEIHYNTGGLGGTATNEFSVGCINNSYHITGNIAQVSIYNRALSAAEVSQNYNALKSRYI